MKKEKGIKARNTLFFLILLRSYNMKGKKDVHRKGTEGRVKRKYNKSRHE